MSKKYFEFEDSDFCYTLEYFNDKMLDEGLTEIEVFEAEREVGSSFFWCRHHSVACEKNSDTCGVDNCADYEPRNGKNGICRHNGYCYTPIKKVTLKLYKNDL
jgi:hypothetical protein